MFFFFFFQISSISVLMSPFSFLIFLIQILPLFPLFSFGRGFFYLVDSLKEPAFGIADSLYCFLCFYFVGFGQDYDYLLPSNPLEFSCVRLFLV